MFLFFWLYPVECRWVLLCASNDSRKMVIRKLNNLTTRLATLLVLHAAGAGLASPAVLITKSVARVAAEWLPTDNQTLYRIAEGEKRSLELNTSTIKEATVFITISPCTKDFHWALYYGKAGNSNGHLSLKKEDSTGEMASFSLLIVQNDQYLLQLSSLRGGSAVVSVRGEPTRPVRLRLRVRSRRRLAANWDPSPIDPQDTLYCVVASHRRNYTSICSAQYDIKMSRFEKNNRQESDQSKTDRFIESGRPKPDRLNASESFTEVDNKIDVETDSFSMYEGNFKNVFRRKKIGRSTKVTDEDPVIACVGERTHHLIENLDPSRTYFVSVFGIGRDRLSGSLLATGSVRARTSTAKRLRENSPNKSEIKGRSVYYFKATSADGAWFTLTTCGGPVDVEVLVRGKRLFVTKNVDPHKKFFVPAPKPNSSIQETSDEGSIQFDSSSEESRVRFVIKIVPSRWDRSGPISVEITASTTRWGINTPELMGDGSTVRELRQRRSCRSTQIAFLPATHNATDVIRYCVTARETSSGEHYTCTPKKSPVRTQCVDYGPPQQQSKVIMQRIYGLKAGRKYAIQVMAINKGSSVPYNTLYIDTNVSCKENLSLENN